MNKIIAIGDTHGRDTWKKIVEKESDADTIIFIGDYFDTFDPALRGRPEMENFKEIVAFAREKRGKVVLLIGNHDFHYMECAQEQYSGYNKEFAPLFSKLLADASDLLTMCHIQGGHMFTHAGVSTKWLEDNNCTVDDINNLYKTKPEAFRFYRGDKSGYGDNWHQSPIWVRPESLVPNAVQDYIQVVGHTHQEYVSYYEGSEPTRLVMIDCLDNVDEYLTVINGQPQTSTLHDVQT